MYTCVCVFCVCADQQDGDCKCNSNHDLHVLLHQTDDSGGAGLQEETVMSLLIIILYISWFYVSADVQLTFSETILNSPCCKHRYRCSLCLLRCSGRSLELVSSLMVRSPDHNTSAGRKSVDKSFPQTVDLFLQINHRQKWIITVHNSFISTSRIPMLSVFKNKRQKQITEQQTMILLKLSINLCLCEACRVCRKWQQVILFILGGCKSFHITSVRHSLPIIRTFLKKRAIYSILWYSYQQAEGMKGMVVKLQVRRHVMSVLVTYFKKDALDSFLPCLWWKNRYLEPNHSVLYLNQVFVSKSNLITHTESI